ncbi:MAG: hypothetical protein FWF76_01065 [Oscillospiraceae bacterium]|nr:hypothetical protein [Oscillospiraceae bacterium]
MKKSKFPLSEDAGLVVGGSAGIYGTGVALHGNSARVNPVKSVIPQWDNVVSDHKTRGYHRLDGIDTLERKAELAKEEVDNNPL